MVRSHDSSAEPWGATCLCQLCRAAGSPKGRAQAQGFAKVKELSCTQMDGGEFISAFSR